MSGGYPTALPLLPLVAFCCSRAHLGTYAFFFASPAGELAAPLGPAPTPPHAWRACCFWLPACTLASALTPRPPPC